jgi:adenosylcobinamide-phosphate synthase
VPEALETIVVAMLAVAIDVALGDPPNRYHPVAWMGTAIRSGTKYLARGSSGRLLISGGALVIVVGGLSAAGAGIVAVLARAWTGGIIIEALALKAMLAFRGLRRAGALVADDLRRNDLGAARLTVARHLVSRPTGSLDEPHVASATIESLAENLVDGLVAPLCFYVAFGLPGAAFYRAVNTADAMIGYRDGALEHFGKVAARLDDLLNLVPARVSGVALAVGAFVGGGDGRQAFRVMWRQHARTASPNAGWPMSAMAGLLGVRLEKVGHYRLGDGRAPQAESIVRSLVVVRSASLTYLLLLALGLSVR